VKLTKSALILPGGYAPLFGRRRGKKGNGEKRKDRAKTADIAVNRRVLTWNEIAASQEGGEIARKGGKIFNEGAPKHLPWIRAGERKCWLEGESGEYYQAIVGDAEREETRGVGRLRGFFSNQGENWGKEKEDLTPQRGKL